MNQAEAFLLEFHRLHPGCTRVAFAAGLERKTQLSSYELLSSLAVDDSVLDLGCGDGHLMSLLAKRPLRRSAVGIDFSPDELATARSRGPKELFVQGKAQRLPFADGSFRLALSHFAFHLMSELDIVVSELARILTPDGRFATIIGGGPKVGDTFEVFLELLQTQRSDTARFRVLASDEGAQTTGFERCSQAIPGSETRSRSANTTSTLVADLTTSG